MSEELTPGLLSSFKVAKISKVNTRSVNSIDFDDNNSLILTSSDDESIRIYSLNSGKLHNTVYSKKYGCHLARFTHRSNNIIYASTKVEDSIRYMSLHDNKYLRYFKGHSDRVVSMEFSPENDTIISASLDNTVKFWDLRSPNSTGYIDIIGTNPLIAFDPSGTVFALGLSSKTLRLYSTKNQGSGPFLSQLISDSTISPPAEWTNITFSNDGLYILISTRAAILYLLDAIKATIIHRLSLLIRLTGHSNPLGLPMIATFTPNARFVMCGCMYLLGASDGKIHVWDCETGYRINEMVWHHDPPKVIGFSPGSLLFASADTTLAFWTPPPLIA